MTNEKGQGGVYSKEQKERDMELIRKHLMEVRVDAKESESTAPSSVLWSLDQRCDDGSSIRRDDDGLMRDSSNVFGLSKNQPSSLRKRILFTARTLFIDLPLFCLFCLCCTTCTISHIFHTFYTPMVQSAARVASDTQLQNEYTYYERYCNSLDVTSRKGEGLTLTDGMTPRQAVDTVMTHGTAIIPQLLDPDTVLKLRQFIVRRNGELTRAEKIPLSQGRNRISFGIDATEDPIVAVALKEVATHELLQGLLQGLVGVDPAVTEITAITARPGAPDQLWHPDVKPQGSPVKFARTYAHSYSLFITLQDTTSAMGATTMCPGTHYCVNSLEDVCERHGFQLNEASPDGLWHSGDGAILSQQVWHRGAKHTDGINGERVVFIVSFIGRPDPSRQLARGTYFHMKWLSWGHTVRDLLDAHVSMTKPFSILRALSLWKPANRNWGYDLMTASVMRIANVQNGMTAEDLPAFALDIVQGLLGVPEFLHGPVPHWETEGDVWTPYLEATISNVMDFVLRINIAVLAVYFTFVLILCLVKRSLRPSKSAFFRLLLTHAIPVMVASRILYNLHNSDWGRKVIAGNFLRPPFPDHLLLSAGNQSLPTTLPTRYDVLVGSRFDVMYLGAFDRWLDFHPGNVEFLNQVQQCSRMPISLDKQCINFVLASQRGRLLEQDWRTGDWIIMSYLARQRFARVELQKARNSVLSRLAKSISILIAYNRFDISPSGVSRFSLEMLQNLKDRIFDSHDKPGPSLLLSMHAESGYAVKSRLPPCPTLSSRVMLNMEPRTPHHSRWTIQGKKADRFKVGDLVWVNWKGKGDYFRGIISRVKPKSQKVHVAYDDGEHESNVPMDRAHHDVQLERNAMVMWKHEGLVEKVKVERVRPSGRVDVRRPGGTRVNAIHPLHIDRIDYAFQATERTSLFDQDWDYVDL